jgi:4-azaleucine resistance transporter AzlC
VVIYSGASQFLTVGLVTAGAPLISILVTNLVLNLRHVVLSTSLARRYRLDKRLPAAVVSFGITDETFVVASNEKSARVSTGFLLGLNATAYLSWIAGTVAGAIFAGWIPADWASSLGVALYAMFIALLVPAMAKSAQVSAVAVVAALLSWALHDVLGSGWSVVAATLLAALVGTILDRKRVNPS